jgi:type IV secretion system protein TrbL
VLYVGAFAYIIGNFNSLSGIVFRSFAGLGLQASWIGHDAWPAACSPGVWPRPASMRRRPSCSRSASWSGFPEVFINMAPIVVLFLAWLVVIVSFFVLAVQLFVTLMEFKLTTLAGFVLVPFALWNKTSFLAEKVLGNVVSSGIKVLVLAVIVGIGSGLFSEFTTAPGAEPSIDHALVIMLAALSMLGLGIFGPGIATGLVSGAPQLGAGAVAGTALGATGLAVAGGAAVAGAGSAVAAGARMAPGAAARAAIGGRCLGGPFGPVASAGRCEVGLRGRRCRVLGGGVACAPLAQAWPTWPRTGASAVGQKMADGAKAVKDKVSGFVAEAAAPAATGAESAMSSPPTSAPANEPAWAQRMRRRQQIGHAATTAAHTLRGGDGGGSGSGPSLRDSDS